MFVRLVMNVRGLSAAALVFLVLTLAACGGATTPPADDGGDGDAEQTQDVGENGGDEGGDDEPATADICNLVSDEEIEEIAGQAVTESSGETSCDWTLSENNLITVRYEGSYDAGCEIAREYVCEEEVEQVSGVGDEAIWCPDVSVLYFNTAGQSLAVQLVLFGEDPLERPERDVATDLAELVVDRL